MIKDLEIEKVEIDGWCGKVEVDCIKGKKVIVVLILCVGLGMMDGVLEYILSVCISVVGIYCDEEILKFVLYFKKLVNDVEECLVIVVDLMLVIGGLMIVIFDLFKNVGCKYIKVLVFVVAFEGIEVLKVSYFDIEFYMVLIDSYLNEYGYIVFGLGDVGDKIFGMK